MVYGLRQNIDILDFIDDDGYIYIVLDSGIEFY